MEKEYIRKLIEKKEFSGSSPPEIFIGRNNYPNIQAGILAPVKTGETNYFSSPEYWFSKQASIKEIIDFRNQLIYSKFKANVKQAPDLDYNIISSNSSNSETKKFLKSMALVSMTSKSLDID